jgi:signal transduction histidine kinase
VSDELAELKQKHERLKLLYEVSNVIHSTLEPQAALELIVEQAVNLTHASSGSVVLINPNSGFLEIEASRGLPPAAAQLRLRVGEGITGWVARTGRPARVGNVRADPRYIMVRENVCSELTVPLLVNGDLRGMLNVDSDREDAFSEDDQSLLEELGVQAAGVIHHTWMYEQFRQRARLFETLAKVSQTINSTLNLDEALAAITREACQLMEAKMCSLLLLDESQEWLDLRASHGAGPDYINKPRLPLTDSLVGTVVRRQKAIQVENVQISSRYQNVEVAQREGLVSLLSVPLLFGGKAIGALNIYLGQPHVFSNEEIRILGALAGLSAIAIEKARLYERVVELEDHLRQNEKLSALGLLAAEVAHEIRNPLTVMKMLFHSLDLQFPEDDPRAMDSRVITEKMDHLNKIVEQILTFARTAEPTFGPVDLARVAEELGLLVRHKLRQHNITLEREAEPGLPLVNGDAAQLGQAFLNLVLNAVEAMPQGGTLRLRLRRLPRDPARPATHVVAEFADTGEGMSEEQRRKAFTSLLSTTRAKGTGLGLALVARIVEAHQGKVSVKSLPGQGSVFRIMLPVG